VFDSVRREQVRTELLLRACADERVVGAAVTGSAARGAEDRWSDVDLVFAVAPGLPVATVLGDWSVFTYDELGALHHFDLQAGPASYRAFLLSDLLEVDLGFTPADDFGHVGNGGFHLVFGQPVESQLQPLDVDHVIGLVWHHVLHARVSLERGRLWQAEHWISATRDHVLSLACARLGLPTSYAKGADLLPAEISGRLAGTLVCSLEPTDLASALRTTTAVLLAELEAANPRAAAVLRQPLRELMSS